MAGRFGGYFYRIKSVHAQNENTRKMKNRKRANSSLKTLSRFFSLFTLSTLAFVESGALA